MSPAAITPPNRSASKEKVVRGLLAGLLAGKYKGGDRFTEALGSERFGVSRTPVREALLDLQALGLVELRRNCGAIVLPFGTDDLRQIYAVRSLLEVEAARLSASSIDPADLKPLVQSFQKIKGRGGTDPNWELDRALHRVIAGKSGNRRLAAEIERYSSLVQTMREIVGTQTLGIHTATADEHLAILDALMHNDAESAARAMADHLRQASDSAIAAMKRLRKEA